MLNASYIRMLWTVLKKSEKQDLLKKKSVRAHTFKLSAWLVYDVLHIKIDLVWHSEEEKYI